MRAVANAAASGRKAFLTADVEGVAWTWDVCLWGTFHLFQLAANRMLDGDLRIVEDHLVGATVLDIDQHRRAQVRGQILPI